MSLSVPSDGVVVTLSYDLATHQVSTKVSKPGAAPDLKKAKAFWVEPGLLAWPANGVPAGANPALLDWRLHWSVGLAVDAEAVTGGSVADLTYDPAGLPADIAAAHGAQGLPRTAAVRKALARRATSCAGRWPSRCTTTTAPCSTPPVSRPPVLDSLYAGKASTRSTAPPSVATHRHTGSGPPRLSRCAADLAGGCGGGRTGRGGHPHADGACRRRLVDGPGGRTERAVPLRGHGVRAEHLGRSRPTSSPTPTPLHSR